MFTSNFSAAEVSAFFGRIPEVTGVDVKKLCMDYEDSHLPEKSSEQLKALGLDIECGFVDLEDYIQILIFLLQKVEPTLEAEPFYAQTAIRGVGYGLFSL